MEFIDTHAHLYADEFKDDRQNILDKAKQQGVNRVILPAIDSESHGELIKMAKDYPTTLYPLMGLHPTSVNDNYKNELAIVEKNIEEHNIFKGIGEIGIDLYWDKTHYKEQLDAFITQVKWAIDLKWPIVIHTRDSFDEVYNALKPLVTDGLTGIFHCFGGDEDQAKKIIDIGFVLGIGGVVTFKNTNLREVIQKVDLKHIVLETDSPYLAPVPHRGKRNESSYIKLIAETVASVYQCPIEQVAEVTTKNAIKLFGL